MELAKQPAALAAVCLVVVAGATATACGGGSDSGKSGGRPAVTTGRAVTSPPPHRAVRMLGQPELERAAVTSAELPGWQIDTVPPKRADGTSVPASRVIVSRLPPVSPAVCAPLSRMANEGLADRYQYQAAVELSLETEKTSSGGKGNYLMALVSYLPADAPKVMADLRTSLRTCTSFPFDGITMADPKPLTVQTAGDDTVAYTLTQIVGGVDDSGDPDGSTPVKVPIRYEVVRTGATIAVVTAFSPGSPNPTIPPEIVAAQVPELRKVAG